MLRPFAGASIVGARTHLPGDDLRSCRIEGVDHLLSLFRSERQFGDATERDCSRGERSARGDMPQTLTDSSLDITGQVAGAFGFGEIEPAALSAGGRRRGKVPGLMVGMMCPIPGSVGVGPRCDGWR